MTDHNGIQLRMEPFFSRKVLDKSSREVWGLAQAGVSAKLLPELLWDSFCFLQDMRNMRWEQAKTLWQITVTGARRQHQLFTPIPTACLTPQRSALEKSVSSGAEKSARQTQVMALGDSQKHLGTLQVSSKGLLQTLCP